MFVFHVLQRLHHRLFVVFTFYFVYINVFSSNFIIFPDPSQGIQEPPLNSRHPAGPRKKKGLKSAFSVEKGIVLSMSKLNSELVLSSVESILKYANGEEIVYKGEAKKGKKRKFTESIELQITLKNYDPQRDKRFSGTFRLPTIPKFSSSVCVLGSQKHCEKAEQLGNIYLLLLLHSYVITHY